MWLNLQTAAVVNLGGERKWEEKKKQQTCYCFLTETVQTGRSLRLPAAWVQLDTVRNLSLWKARAMRKRGNEEPKQPSNTGLSKSRVPVGPERHAWVRTQGSVVWRGWWWRWWCWRFQLTKATAPQLCSVRLSVIILHQFFVHLLFSFRLSRSRISRLRRNCGSVHLISWTYTHTHKKNQSQRFLFGVVVSVDASCEFAYSWMSPSSASGSLC